jgi:hypothetical protein
MKIQKGTKFVLAIFVREVQKCYNGSDKGFAEQAQERQCGPVV